MKKSLMFVNMLIVISTFSLISCSRLDSPVLDPSLKNKVDFISDGKGTHHIEYSNSTYMLDTENICCVENIDEKVFIGWNGSRFGYINQYFSTTNTNPLFIYESRTMSLYFRDNYNFKSDIFLVENTDIKFVYSNIIGKVVTDNNYQINDSNQIEVVLYSDTCSDIIIKLRIFLYDKNWYAVVGSNGHVYSLTKDFTDTLLENKILEKV